MPITGTETILASAISAAISAELTAAGFVLADEDGFSKISDLITAVSNSVANCIIPHIVNNSLVSTTGSAAAQTGTIS